MAVGSRVLQLVADDGGVVVSDPSGFWSYVHKDDDAESGRIAQLARDLSAQFELITGEPLVIFVDRDDISWGERWRSAIDTSLAAVTFFIPVLTPRYFQSGECRREFNAFARKARQLGVRELVMPVLYVEPPSLRADPPVDELMALANSFQWVDWTERRFAAVGSAEYRSAVASMATRLSAAVSIVEKVDVTPAPVVAPDIPADDDDDDDDAAPGFLDRVASAEKAMFVWADVLTTGVREIERIGDVALAATGKVRESDAAGKGAVGRLAVFTEFAEDLSGPADALLELGNSFAAQLGDVDEGVRAILLRARVELGAADFDPDLPEQTEVFVTQLRELGSVAGEGLGMLATLIDAISGIEDQSRNLRPVFRKLRRGLTLFVDGKAVILGWVELADNLRIPGSIVAA